MTYIFNVNNPKISPEQSKFHNLACIPQLGTERRLKLRKDLPVSLWFANQREIVSYREASLNLPGSPEFYFQTTGPEINTVQTHILNSL